jgi:hypothetical protein
MIYEKTKTIILHIEMSAPVPNLKNCELIEEENCMLGNYT